ncbi:MAG: extracellular solute-binding protein, partial [Eubacteriales bacterium]|nr:extracellular solute-binding protein [Eubacteriales bacterium]
MKKILSLLLALALLCGAVPAAMAQTEITFWHTYSEGEEAVLNDEVIPAFEAAYPDITVNAVRMPYEGLNQQFVTAVAGDVAPDVIRMDITWVAQMAKLGALASVDELDGFDAILADALPGPMATTLYNGKHYGLPLNTNTTAAVFNVERLHELGFSEPPKTLDELLAAVDQADPANEQWLFAIQGSFNWAMLPFIWTLGGSITDADYTTATGYLNGEATVKAMETIKGWYDQNIIGPCILGEAPDTWGGVEAGNYAMIVEGPWFFSGSEANDNYVATTIPTVNGNSYSIVGGEDIVMTKTTKNAEAAWTFMQYMMSGDAQLAMTKAGLIPTMASNLDKMDTSVSAYLPAYVEQLKTANPRT